MRGEEFVNVCQAVVHGNVRFVRNRHSRELGRIVACLDRGFEVYVGERRRELWTHEECEETAQVEDFARLG
jgi:hypothetical protein